MRDGSPPATACCGRYPRESVVLAKIRRKRRDSGETNTGMSTTCARKNCHRVAIAIGWLRRRNGRFFPGATGTRRNEEVKRRSPEAAKQSPQQFRIVVRRQFVGARRVRQGEPEAHG